LDDFWLKKFRKFVAIILLHQRLKNPRVTRANHYRLVAQLKTAKRKHIIPVEEKELPPSK